jgi:hypothetical protein
MSEIIKRAVKTVTQAVSERAVAGVPELQPVTIGTPVSRIDGRQKARCRHLRLRYHPAGDDLRRAGAEHHPPRPRRCH